MENVRAHGTGPFRVAVLHGGPGARGELAPVARRLGLRRGVLEPLQAADSVGGQIEELRLVLASRARLPVTLIGHSWGAWLGGLAAARYPALVKKLILVGSGPFEARFAPDIDRRRLERLPAALAAEYLALLDRLDRAGKGLDGAHLARFAVLTEQADTFEALDPGEAPGPGISSRTLSIFHKVWPEAAKLRATGDLLQRFSTLRCPVVAIHGEADPHPGAGVDLPLSACLSDFRFILLARCGHAPWREKHAGERFFEILDREIGDRV
jgi:pimeloyl-ACP methyl ester carboxylesterase